MMLHQLDRDLVRSLVQGVHPIDACAQLDDEQVARLFAVATWSMLVEPGDAVAGLLTGALGVDRALTLLIEQRTPEEWLDAATQTEASSGSSGISGTASGERGESLVALNDGDVSAADLSAALDRWRPRLSSRAVMQALRAAGGVRAQLLCPGDPSWPAGFDALGPHRPAALWVRGDPAALKHPGGLIALVGSRDATSYGEHMAMDLAAGVSDRGFAVVSGAAYGIDGMAHRACLASRGRTVAFLAGGVDRLYPAAHHDLLLRAVATGAVVSEMPCGSAPTKWRFLQRNRLIAAASHATVVVEAGRRSGSLNTAGHAAALGRPLGAVPGPVTSATSEGCHRLLREYDAVCVTSASDAVELVLGPVEARQPSLLEGDSSESGSGSGEAVRVLDALSKRVPRTTAEIARQTGLAPRAVAATLGVLGLEGAVREEVTGWRRT
ncbi:MAG: DNA-processing protein DprA [Herbiconiux sp.]|nr:DNA-processing protein DprA [Herbiconiux sp.]